MIVRKLLRFFRVKLSDRLPRIPRQFSSDYDPAEVDRVAENLMKLSAIRSPSAIPKLEKRLRRPADDVWKSIPLPKWRSRNTLKSLVGRSLRLLNYDPFKRYAPKRRGFAPR